MQLLEEKYGRTELIKGRLRTANSPGHAVQLNGLRIKGQAEHMGQLGASTTCTKRHSSLLGWA